jgi:cytochrome c peroxidase
MFEKAFGIKPQQITLKEVKKAIASFERTLVAGDSPFDRYFFGLDKKAMSPAAIRGLEVFLGKGRCVSCHTIEQDNALFTNHLFHNIGVAAQRMPANLDELRTAVEEVKKKGVVWRYSATPRPSPSAAML